MDVAVIDIHNVTSDVLQQEKQEQEKQQQQQQQQNEDNEYIDARKAPPHTFLENIRKANPLMYFGDSEWQSFIPFLDQHAHGIPNQIALTWNDDHGKTVDSITYKKLNDLSLSIAYFVRVTLKCHKGILPIFFPISFFFFLLHYYYYYYYYYYY